MSMLLSQTVNSFFPTMRESLRQPIDFSSTFEKHLKRMTPNPYFNASHASFISKIRSRCTKTCEEMSSFLASIKDLSCSEFESHLVGELCSAYKELNVVDRFGRNFLK